MKGCIVWCIPAASSSFTFLQLFSRFKVLSANLSRTKYSITIVVRSTRCPRSKAAHNTLGADCKGCRLPTRRLEPPNSNGLEAAQCEQSNLAQRMQRCGVASAEVHQAWRRAACTRPRNVWERIRITRSGGWAHACREYDFCHAAPGRTLAAAVLVYSAALRSWSRSMAATGDSPAVQHLRLQPLC